ncbi:MAG: GNAT family N-acetyltransferase [Marinobacter sp.]|nr:GNAT family N-acetyltransferase [Marinobacter sp.]
MPESGSPFPHIRVCSSIHDVPEADWNALCPGTYPFIKHGFLKAMEDSGCTSTATGWTPSHLSFWLGDRLVGVAPAWLKSHSMGEYVFDWAWADAYRRYGEVYYPKLLIAVPFTPCQGPRLLLDDAFRAGLSPTVVHQLLDSVCESTGAHSWHLLFPDSDDQRLLDQPGSLHRLGCQFHWHNRGYRSFEAFLGELTSRKRKSIRKERRQVAESGVSFRHFSGTDLPDHVLSVFYSFYQATYFKRGQRPYLNQQFFRQLCATMPDQCHFIMAVKEDTMIAGALFLSDDDTLFGRYWGCLEEYDFLHFETCYYQGIDLAIELGLSTFDAGAQGEHKLIRGFEPVITHSWHGIRHQGFRDAIHRFTLEEADHVQQYFDDATSALPFRQQDTG